MADHASSDGDHLGTTQMQLTELKVFAEALPKCGELTGSYHSDELTV
jgi:hypothetical protein